MNKEEALNDFLKGLRIVLNNASAYPKEHPYFKKSVETFKQKIDALFPFLNPIKIGITPDSLFIDGRYMAKTMLYTDLASVFHFRKIKNIEFKEGLTLDELISFLNSVSLPIKEILRQGGIKNILKKEGSPRLSFEELDYSELLQDEGEEAKDIWVYLFKVTLANEDLNKISEFANNFEKIIRKFKAKDLFEDEELRHNIYNFLDYLKDKVKDKYQACVKELLKLVLKAKDIPQEEKIDKIKAFFKDLDKEELAEALLDTISKDDTYNHLSFQVFNRLFDEDTHRQIAPTLEKKIKEEEFIRANPRVIKRIKELFSVPDSAYILPLYRHALSWISDDNLLKDSFTFDRHLLYVNYIFLLLNLFIEEKNKETIGLISESLLKECNKVIEEKNLEYLKFIWEALDKKIEEDASLSGLFEGLEKCIYNFVENAVFEEQDLIGLEYFIDKLRKSFLGFNFYLDKIFNEGKVNPYVLRLLFKFFPVELPRVYETLEKKHYDIDFLGKIVMSLEGIDSLKAIEMLKKIFYFSNNIIKMEVLRAMQRLSRHDDGFLFSILKEGEPLLKRQALVILARNEETKKQALEELFCIRSPFGRKNLALMEHILIIEDLELKEAKDYLVVLSKRPFFWNRNIRKKAAEVLKKWH